MERVVGDLYDILVQPLTGTLYGNLVTLQNHAAVIAQAFLTQLKKHLRVIML